jgi:hypothetical protein
MLFTRSLQTVISILSINRTYCTPIMDTNLKLLAIAFKGIIAGRSLENVQVFWSFVEEKLDQAQTKKIFLNNNFPEGLKKSIETIFGKRFLKSGSFQLILTNDHDTENKPVMLMHIAAEATYYEGGYEILDFLSGKARNYFNESESDQIFLPEKPLWEFRRLFNVTAIKQNLSKRQFELFLKSKNLRGENLFFYSFSAYSVEDMRKLFDQMVEELGLNETKLFCLERNSKKQNFLMRRFERITIVGDSLSSDFTDDFWSFLKEVFDHNQIKTLLSDVDLNGRNVFSYAAKKHLPIRGPVIKFFKDAFNEDEFDQIPLDTTMGPFIIGLYSE